jgi:ferrous iron transport protein A
MMHQKQHTLCDIMVNDCACIENIITTGSMRRRLLDLGFVKGTQVKCIQKNYTGETLAFSIRGSIIVLRSNDARNITVESINEMEVSNE